MELTILGSGSTGNGYVLQNDKEALVLECGVPRAECLSALGWSTKRVAGCLITHEHGDHARFIEDYLPLMPCYCSSGTAAAIEYRHAHRPKVIEPLRTIQVGGFAVRPIPAEHDAAEPFAYIIDHQDFGRLLFATDTYYLRYRIPNMTNILIECNYSLPILNRNIESGLVPEQMKARTLNSHMSLEHLKEMLRANDLKHVVNIILIHLSPRNSHAEAFVEEIVRLTGKTTYAAHKGLTIPLNETPF